MARCALYLLILLLTAGAAPDDGFVAAASPELERLIETELLGHYDVDALSLVEVTDRTGEWGGEYPGYGLRSVVADFRARRNATWSAGLNRAVIEPICDAHAELFLFCRPQGYAFAGTVEVDLAFTVDGWRVLSKHSRSLRAFPLAGYLRCRPDPGDPDRNRAVLRDCFGAAPPAGAPAPASRQR